MLSTRLLFAVVLCTALPAPTPAAPPPWWSSSDTGILAPGAAQDNYAPANLGQLKHVATQAKHYLDAHLASFGGAGPAINALVAGFEPRADQNYTAAQATALRAANYAPINLGQLKAVAKPYYDRLRVMGFNTPQSLIARGYPSEWAHHYPWNPSDAWNQPGPADKSANYAPANLGQLKLTFSFDLTGFSADRDGDGVPNGEDPNPDSPDTDGDGMPDDWELAHGLNPASAADADEDADGDGLTNAQDFAAGTNPNSSDTDGDGVSDSDDIFPDDERRSEGIHTVRYVPVDLAPAIFGAPYFGLSAAIDNNNKIGLLAVKHDAEGNPLQYKAVSFVAGEAHATIVAKTRTLQANDIDPTGRYRKRHTLYEINASGTAIGNVRTDMIGDLAQISRPPVPDGWAPVGLTAGLKWDTQGTHIAIGHGSRPMIYIGIKNSGVIWGSGLNGNWYGHFVGSVFSTYIEIELNAGNLMRYRYEEDPLMVPGSGDFGWSPLVSGEHGGGSLVSETGLFWGLHQYRSTPSDTTSSYDLKSYAWWDGDDFRHLFGGEDEQTIAFAINSLGHMIGTSPRFTPPESETHPHPEIPLPHPFWNTEGVFTDAYLSLPAQFRSQVALGDKALLTDDNMLLMTGCAIEGPNRAQSWWGETGVFLWKPGTATKLKRLDIDGGIPRMINTNGVAASGPYLLLPVDITPDYNRDKVIDDKDKGKATQEKPYRFWLNNDHDKDDDLDGEPLSGALDNADGSIKSKRDLEDFARLDIYLGGLHEAVVANQIKVGLKWKDTGGTSPSVKVWRNLSPNGGLEYVTDDNVAGQHLQLTNPGHVQGTGTYIIPQQFWQDAGLSASQPKGHILFEGVTAGKGHLVLVFQNAQGQEIGEGSGVWLDLRDVKRFYKRGKAQPENIAAPNGNVVGPPSVSPSYVPDEISQQLAFEADPNEEKKAVIFVHGWSMDYNSYTNFAETMFKRLFHQGFKGRFCSLRWEPLVVAQVFDISVSNGEYNRSEHRAFHYGESLKQFANAIKGEGFSVSLVGHSMGNIVCSSSLQKGLGVQNYVLMEAAVPAGSYDTSGGSGAGGVNGYARFWNAEVDEPTPDFHQVPGGELTQGYRGFLEGIGNNVAGDVVNFHNSFDYALATGHKAFGLLEANWEANEEDYKPDGNAGPWHYEYYPTRPNLEERATHEYELFVGRSARFITESYEMKSFVARPRSKAVGAVEGDAANPLAGGAINSSVNMRTTYGFGREDYDHSGQFNRRIQQLPQLYERVFEIVK